MNVLACETAEHTHPFGFWVVEVDVVGECPQEVQFNLSKGWRCIASLYRIMRVCACKYVQYMQTTLYIEGVLCMEDV